MKFQGIALKAIVYDVVHIPRPAGGMLTFKIRPTGLGEEAKGERLFPNPRAPVDFVYDKKGIIVRDPRSEKPLREPNPTDPDYTRRLEYVSLMQMIVQAVDAITFEGSDVEWDTAEVPGSKGFYEAVLDEMKSAGIGFGDIRLINKRAMELGNLDAKALEKAAESFSEKGDAA